MRCSLEWPRLYNSGCDFAKLWQCSGSASRWWGSGSWCFLCGSWFVLDADVDPAFHPDDDPDPTFQIKAQTHEKCSNRLVFDTFWLGLCKSMWIPIRIQLIALMLVRILILIWWGSGFPKWCGSIIQIHNIGCGCYLNRYSPITEEMYNVSYFINSFHNGHHWDKNVSITKIIKLVDMAETIFSSWKRI